MKLSLVPVKPVKKWYSGMTAPPLLAGLRTLGQLKGAEQKFNLVSFFFLFFPHIIELFHYAVRRNIISLIL